MFRSSLTVVPALLKLCTIGQKSLLILFLLFTEEIKTNIKKDDIPAIVALSETLMMAYKSKKEDKPKSELRIQIPFKIKRQVKTTLPRTETVMTDGTKIIGLSLVVNFDEIETKHTSSEISFSVGSFSLKKVESDGFNFNACLLVLSIVLSF